MAVADSKIEEQVVEYIRDAISRNDLPNRHNAIRHITGALDVLPSSVAKVMTAMIAAGTLKHLQSNDRLELLERAEPKAAEPKAEPQAAPAKPVPAAKGKGKKS